jgi:hypothetical protein
MMLLKTEAESHYVICYFFILGKIFIKTARFFSHVKFAFFADVGCLCAGM